MLQSYHATLALPVCDLEEYCTTTCLSSRLVWVMGTRLAIIPVHTWYCFVCATHGIVSCPDILEHTAKKGSTLQLK